MWLRRLRHSIGPLLYISCNTLLSWWRPKQCWTDKSLCRVFWSLELSVRDDSKMLYKDKKTTHHDVDHWRQSRINWSSRMFQFHIKWRFQNLIIDAWIPACNPFDSGETLHCEQKERSDGESAHWSNQSCWEGNSYGRKTWPCRENANQRLSSPIKVLYRKIWWWCFYIRLLHTRISLCFTIQENSLVRMGGM